MSPINLGWPMRIGIWAIVVFCLFFAPGEPRPDDVLITQSGLADLPADIAPSGPIPPGGKIWREKFRRVHGAQWVLEEDGFRLIRLDVVEASGEVTSIKLPEQCWGWSDTGVVSPGETLWGLTKNQSGAWNDWRKVAAHNNLSIHRRNGRDYVLLRPGQILCWPLPSSL